MLLGGLVLTANADHTVAVTRRRRTCHDRWPTRGARPCRAAATGPTARRRSGHVRTADATSASLAVSSGPRAGLAVLRHAVGLGPAPPAAGDELARRRGRGRSRPADVPPLIARRAARRSTSCSGPATTGSPTTPSGRCSTTAWTSRPTSDRIGLRLAGPGARPPDVPRAAQRAVRAGQRPGGGRRPAGRLRPRPPGHRRLPGHRRRRRRPHRPAGPGPAGRLVRFVRARSPPDIMLR